jgi:hypothetical protein
MSSPKLSSPAHQRSRTIRFEKEKQQYTHTHTQTHAHKRQTEEEHDTQVGEEVLLLPAFFSNSQRLANKQTGGRVGAGWGRDWWCSELPSGLLIHVSRTQLQRIIAKKSLYAVAKKKRTPYDPA